MRSIALSLLISVGLAVADDDTVPRPAPAKWTEVKAGSDGSVWLKVPDDKSEWELIDRANGARLDVPPKSEAAVFGADPRIAASYRVIATDGTGKLLRYMIVVGEGAPPPPGPTPPPKPIDDLTKLLQAAYTADPGATKAQDLKQLIALYAQCAEFAMSTTVATAGELREAVSKAATTLLPDDPETGRRLAGLRKAISTELGSVLPADAEAALTEAVRSAASAAFSKYAKALGGVVP